MQASIIGRPVRPLCQGFEMSGVVLVEELAMRGVQRARLHPRGGLEPLSEVIVPVQPRAEHPEALAPACRLLAALALELGRTRLARLTDATQARRAPGDVHRQARARGSRRSAAVRETARRVAVPRRAPPRRARRSVRCRSPRARTAHRSRPPRTVSRARPRPRPSEGRADLPEPRASGRGPPSPGPRHGGATPSSRGRATARVRRRTARGRCRTRRGRGRRCRPAAGPVSPTTARARGARSPTSPTATIVA